MEPRNLFVGAPVAAMRAAGYTADYLPAKCANCGEPVAVELDAIAYVADKATTVLCADCTPGMASWRLRPSAEAAARIERQWGRTARRRAEREARSMARLARVRAATEAARRGRN